MKLQLFGEDLPNAGADNGLVLDFTDVSDGFELLPEGKYNGVIFGAEVKTNKAGDGKYINWTIKIPNGPNKGRQFWYSTSLKPNALWKVKAVLKALGVEVPKGEFNIDFNELLGKPCTFSLIVGEWNGEERNEVDDIFKYDPNIDPEGHVLDLNNLGY